MVVYMDPLGRLLICQRTRELGTWVCNSISTLRGAGGGGIVLECLYPLKGSLNRNASAREVGGKGTGGLVVRTGQSLKSKVPWPFRV